MKYRDVIKLLQENGWEQVKQVGSHRKFKHPDMKGSVTVPGHQGDEAAPKTLDSILKQAGLK